MEEVRLRLDRVIDSFYDAFCVKWYKCLCVPVRTVKEREHGGK